jgi:sigma-B regulation protein RsbU (phosphoserine phosphatase)
VGGDCYDWIHLGNGRLALVIADVSGKGTPASLLMASVHASMQALAGTATPAEVIERLNRFLFGRTHANRYVTLFYAELDVPSRRLHYVNAGHVPPYRIASDGTVNRLVEGGFALGLFDEAVYEAGQVSLEPGDIVAMVTDGVTEANSPDDREFSDEQVCEAVRTLSGGSASQIKEGLVAAVNGWTGGTGSRDDMTVLILKVL